MKSGSTYALVTGASSGIGRHIARELAGRGYPVIAVSNQPEQLESLKKELEDVFGVAVHTMVTDLARESAAAEVFRLCEAQGLSVSILVNNAGMLVTRDIVEVSYEKVQAILQLHVNTPALLCRLFGERMAERGSGYILNVSSISAVMPYPVISLYGPSKSFLRSFTRAIRTELGTRGITVTCLLPGATATALYDPGRVNIPLAIRLGVMKMPGDVARAAVRALFRGRAEYIPGIFNKLTVFTIPFIPQIVIRQIYVRRKKKGL